MISYSQPRDKKKGAVAVGGAQQKCLAATQTTTTAQRETGAGKELVKQKNIVGWF